MSMAIKTGHVTILEHIRFPTHLKKNKITINNLPLQ